MLILLIPARPLCASVADLSDNGAPTRDLAAQASQENLHQVSASVLRTEIQRETDPARRQELSRRLVILLVKGGRSTEALSVISTLETTKDPLLTYWKGVALLGDGDDASAKSVFESLLQPEPGVAVPGIPRDEIVMGLARALRGTGDAAGALAVLEKIPPDSPVAFSVLPEKASDLLALGRTAECLKLLQSYTPPTEEGKATATYLKALAKWRSGDAAAARKLFAQVPTTLPWYASAATLGGALSLSSAKKPQPAIELLEKSLDASDETPLLEERFRLLDQLYASAAVSDTGILKKWSEDASRPARGRLASFYQAKGEFRLKHAEKGESILEAFVRNHPDDPLADQARLLLASSKLGRGDAAGAQSWLADRPAAPAALRARLAYLRGLAAASAGHPEEAMAGFQSAAGLDPELAKEALFNRTVVIAGKDKGKLDISEAARSAAGGSAGLPSEEMEFQIALDLIRRGEAAGMERLGQVADQSPDPLLKSRARLAAAEWNMKVGEGEAAKRDLARAVRENSGEPEREEYLEVFLKDTGRKSDTPGIVSAARAFLKAHPESRFAPEVRLKLAEALLNSGDVQGARVEFEQLAVSGTSGDLGRHALFLAAQAAARAMDPSSIDDSLMLLERVAQGGGNDQLVWQARLQQGALKNAQNLPLEALAIYDKILSATGPDKELRAAALMAKADTLNQLGKEQEPRSREALSVWKQISDDPAMSLRWRNQALCKEGIVLEKLGEGDAALAAYYEAFKAPRITEPEQLWHDKAAFEAARLLETRRQWNDAVTLYGQIIGEGGPRSEEAWARLSKLKLENFLWEN